MAESDRHSVPLSAAALPTDCGDCQPDSGSGSGSGSDSLRGGSNGARGEKERRGTGERRGRKKKLRGEGTLPSQSLPPPPAPAAALLCSSGLCFSANQSKPYQTQTGHNQLPGPVPATQVDSQQAGWGSEQAARTAPVPADDCARSLPTRITLRPAAEAPPSQDLPPGGSCLSSTRTPQGYQDDCSTTAQGAAGQLFITTGT